MGILDFFKRKSQIDMEQLIKKIDGKHLIRRYVILILALLLSATSYNLFFVTGKIVTGGVSGTAIIVEELLNIDPSVFILVVNLILIVFSYFLLGKGQTVKNLVGSVLYPLFVSLTSNIINYIDIAEADLLIKTLFGAVLSGVASGLIFKVGFSGGGTDIIIQILS